jgi:hypothetical protein
LRHQKDGYGKALQATAKRRPSGGEMRKYALTNWKIALTEASNISGWDTKKFGLVSLFFFFYCGMNHIF